MTTENGSRIESEQRRAEIVADRDRLVAYLQNKGECVSTAKAAKDLRMGKCRPGYLAGRFPRYFGRWNDERGHDRRMFIDLHPHLRLARTA